LENLDTMSSRRLNMPKEDLVLGFSESQVGKASVKNLPLVVFSTPADSNFANDLTLDMGKQSPGLKYSTIVTKKEVASTNESGKPLRDIIEQQSSLKTLPIFANRQNEKDRRIYYEKPFEKSDLNFHMRIHPVVKPFLCIICFRGFTQETLLQKHFLIHTGEKSFKCDKCVKKFRLRSNMVKHQRIHTGEKPYKCLLCDRVFTMSSNRNKHILTHTGESAPKNQKCLQCGKAFTCRSALTRHIRTHTGERPYKCSECFKMFNQKNTLVRHWLVHSGRKPYKCSSCARAFTRKSYLFDHQQKH